MNLRGMIDLLIEIWEKEGDDFTIKGWYDAGEYSIGEIEVDPDAVYINFEEA